LLALAPPKPITTIGGERGRSCMGRSAKCMRVREERFVYVLGRKESGVGVG
jgi:hypothetical protein